EYWITFRVSDADAAALDDATHVEYDERVRGVIRDKRNEGVAMVVFQVRAPVEQPGEVSLAPYNEALDAYSKLRRNAKLPDPSAPPGMATTTYLRDVPSDDTPSQQRRVANLPHERLLLRARTLYEHGAAT